jgi:hydrogenase expression/formation protein HypC
MCLAVPGKVVEWLERESPFARAAVEFGGVRREVNMAFVPEAGEGDYVLVHAGVAISCIDAEEAAKVFETLNELALVEEELDAAADLPANEQPQDAEP